MIIDRFGTTYATAYELPVLKGKQKFTTTRQPVAVAVSGTSGAYAFSPVAGGFPVNPVTVSLQANLKGTSFSNVDTVLEAFIKATIAYSEVDDSPYKLWGTLRDQTTHVWAWAYPIKYDRSEEAGKYYTNLPVTLDFYLPEGVWYAQTETSITDSNASHDISSMGNFTSIPTEEYFLASSGRFLTYAAFESSYYRSDIQSKTRFRIDVDLQNDSTGLVDLKPCDYEIKKTGATDAYAGNVITYNRIPWLAYSSLASDNTQSIVATGWGGEITNATNATPIVITSGKALSVVNGDIIYVEGVEGNTAANGVWQVANLSGSTFELSGSVGNGTYTANTGKFTYGSTITSLQNTSGTLVTIVFPKPHGLVSPTDVGNYLSIIGVSDDDFAISDTVDGEISINKIWTINTIPSTTSITIDVAGSGTTTMTSGLVILSNDEKIFLSYGSILNGTHETAYYKTYIF